MPVPADATLPPPASRATSPQPPTHTATAPDTRTTENFFSDPEGYPREKILEESIDGFGRQCCKRRFWDTLVFHRVKDTQRPRFFEHPPAFLTGTVPMCYNMGHQGLGVRD